MSIDNLLCSGSIRTHDFISTLLASVNNRTTATLESYFSFYRHLLLMHYNLNLLNFDYSIRNKFINKTETLADVNVPVGPY